MSFPLFLGGVLVPRTVQIIEDDYQKFGATVAVRPDADTVPIGATFMAVDSAEIWQSNGTTWVVLV